MNKDPTEYLAHISEDGRKQTLIDHMTGTSHRSGEFGAEFGAEEDAEQAGQEHDDGKAVPEFQRRLAGSSERVDHSTAGAQYLLQRGYYEAACAVAGHHGGLPDVGNPTDTADAPTLFGRSKRKIEPWVRVLPPLPAPPHGPCKPPFETAFYTRMLFSCLVDADYLDTEAFMRGAEPPRGGQATIPELLARVRAQADAWLNAPVERDINRARNGILQSCIDAGRSFPRGLYTLTVPTGGGKTFASLAFALEQAAAQGLKRVIYIIPYTSIIDQTVQTFSALLGEENVLGHYSSADFLMKESGEMTELDYRRTLAAENWDAPVIVTTSVQFFESLYANRPSRCRKLHNIANAVLIFDEAQTLPTDYLTPCLAAIAELVEHYRASAVLCTATQPALDDQFHKHTSKLQIREICPDSTSLYETLRRTTLCDLGAVTQETLATRLSTAEQVLCVVNRRKTAQELYAALPREGSFCLTTLLCAADRREKLDEIRRRLRDGLPCRVVSTSLIEAGVDVDFPTAYREKTGLDSILQTAGRCNREGRRSAEKSYVYLFSLDGIAPPQMVRQNLNAFNAVLRRYPDALQSPEAIHSYFSILYPLKGDAQLDKKGIMDAFERGINGARLPFAQVAERFRIIESPTRTVYLPIGEGAALCDRLRQQQYSRSLFRRLGLYSVEVYEEHYQSLLRAGALDPVDDRAAILTDLRQYDPVLGLKLTMEEGSAFLI